MAISIRVVRALWVVLLACAACGTDPGGAAEAGARAVEIGTGADHFEPLADHQQVQFTQGPQGGGRYQGFHVWGAVRTTGFATTQMRVQLRYLLASELRAVALEERILDLEDLGGGAAVAYGFAPRIEDCCAVRGVELLMRAHVEAGDGASGDDQRLVLTSSTCGQAGTCP